MKNEYYHKLVDEATSHNIWSFRKWTTSNRTYMLPPLDQGEDETLAVTHAQKCDTLRTHLFPELPSLVDEPTLDLRPHSDNIEYVSITKREVKDAIFTAAQLNAPGISRLMGEPGDGHGLYSKMPYTTWLDYVWTQDTTPRYGGHPLQWLSKNRIGNTPNPDPTD